MKTLENIKRKRSLYEKKRRKRYLWLKHLGLYGVKPVPKIKIENIETKEISWWRKLLNYIKLCRSLLPWAKLKN